MVQFFKGLLQCLYFQIEYQILVKLLENDSSIFTWWMKNKINKNLIWNDRSWDEHTSRLSNFLLNKMKNSFPVILSQFSTKTSESKESHSVWVSPYLFALSCGVNWANFAIISSILLKHQKTQYIKKKTLFNYFFRVLHSV